VCCPSCSTRYSLPAMGQARPLLTCRSCGNQWRELPMIDAIETIDITEAPPSRRLPAVVDNEERPDFEASRLAQMARDAQAEHQLKQAKRRRRLQQWAVFGAIVFAPFMAAAAMPETVVTAAPISIKAYEALGYDINLYGLEIRGIDRDHVIMDGQRILAIKGHIANVDNDVRKIPWLRFALTGPSGEELYTWTLDTSTKPVLRPGETTSFVTRISAPPEAAQNLQIRFAQPQEIGINPAP
jgi:hypothetical protein